MNVAKAWHALAPRGSPVSLACVRIAMGACASINAAVYCLLHTQLLQTEGLVSAKFSSGWIPGIERVNPLILVDAYWLWIALPAVAFVSSVLTMVGLFTRVATVIAFLTVWTLQLRNPFVLNSADDLIRITLLLLSLADAGAAYSLDVHWGRRSRRESVLLSAQSLISLQIALMYFSAALYKASSPAWRSGDITWIVLHWPDYARFLFLADWMPEYLGKILGFSALYIEVLIPVAFLLPGLRKPAVVAGILLHVGIGVLLVIPLFSFAVIAMYPAYLRGEDIEAWLGCLRERVRSLRSAVSLPGTDTRRHNPLP